MYACSKRQVSFTCLADLPEPPTHSFAHADAMLSCTGSVESLSALYHSVYESFHLLLLLVVGEQQQCVEVAVSGMSEDGTHNPFVREILLPIEEERVSACESAAPAPKQASSENSPSFRRPAPGSWTSARRRL